MIIESFLQNAVLVFSFFARSCIPKTSKAEKEYYVERVGAYSGLIGICNVIIWSINEVYDGIVDAS